MIESDHIVVPDPNPSNSGIRFPVIARFSIATIYGVAGGRMYRHDRILVDTGAGYTCMPLSAAWTLFPFRSRPASLRDADRQMEWHLDRAGAEVIPMIQADGTRLEGRRVRCVVQLQSS